MGAEGLSGPPWVIRPLRAHWEMAGREPEGTRVKGKAEDLAEAV